jgi:hypothetical protein
LALPGCAEELQKESADWRAVLCAVAVQAALRLEAPGVDLLNKHAQMPRRKPETRTHDRLLSQTAGFSIATEGRFKAGLTVSGARFKDVGTKKRCPGSAIRPRRTESV